ncbi:MAG: cysteine peptidase family C39 domain-containing protein [Candidatus Omnitrophica bacterium]|nr:cysteine peptidase family C39 domain-containing protein [Candidatus Omnitrophota bacterium]
MNINPQQTENSIKQPKKEFKSNFKAWIRMVAFILVAVFLPEQVAQAVEYDWRVIWNKPTVGTIAPAYLKDLSNIDSALAIRNILKDIANKPINSIRVSSNLTINLDKPLEMSNQKIDEITEWLKGKPCGSKALYDYLNYVGIKASESDIAIIALAVDILNDVVKPEGRPKVIKNSLYALEQAAKFFGANLYPVEINANTELSNITPFVAHFKYEHYVLVTRVTEDKVYYTKEHREEFLPKATFLSKFSGYALTNVLPLESKILSPVESKQILGARDPDEPTPNTTMPKLPVVTLPSSKHFNSTSMPTLGDNIYYSTSFVRGLNAATAPQTQDTLYKMDGVSYRRQTIFNTQNGSVAGYTWLPINVAANTSYKQLAITSSKYNNVLIVVRTPDVKNNAAPYLIGGSLLSSLHEYTGTSYTSSEGLSQYGTHIRISLDKASDNYGFTTVLKQDPATLEYNYEAEAAGLKVKYPYANSGEIGSDPYDRTVKVYAKYSNTPGGGSYDYDGYVTAVYATPNLGPGGMFANNMDVNLVEKRNNLTYAFCGNLSNSAIAAPITFTSSGQDYAFAAWVNMKPLHLQVDTKNLFNGNYTNVAMWDYQRITAATRIQFGKEVFDSLASNNPGSSTEEGNLVFQGWNPGRSSKIKDIYVEAFNEHFHTATISTILEKDGWIVGVDKMYAGYGGSIGDTSKTYFFPIQALKTQSFNNYTLASLWTQTPTSLTIEAFNNDYRAFDSSNPILYPGYRSYYDIGKDGSLKLWGTFNDKNDVVLALNHNGTWDNPDDDFYVYIPDSSKILNSSNSNGSYYDFNVGSGLVLIEPGNRYTGTSPRIGGTLGSTVIEKPASGSVSPEQYSFYSIDLGIDKATGNFNGLAISPYDADQNGKISIKELNQAYDIVVGDTQKQVDTISNLKETDFEQWLKDTGHYDEYCGTINGVYVDYGLGGGYSNFYIQMEIMDEYDQAQLDAKNKGSLLDNFTYVDPTTGDKVTLQDISTSTKTMLDNPDKVDLLDFSSNLVMASIIDQNAFPKAEGVAQNKNEEAMGVNFKATVKTGIQWNEKANRYLYTTAEVELNTDQANIAKGPDFAVIKDGWKGTFNLTPETLSSLRAEYYEKGYRDLAVSLVGINAYGTTWGDIGIGAVVVLTTVAAAAATFYIGGAGGAVVAGGWATAGAIAGILTINVGVSVFNAALIKNHLTGEKLTDGELFVSIGLGLIPAAGGIAGRFIGTAAMAGTLASVASKTLVVGSRMAFISGQITQASSYICNMTLDPTTKKFTTHGPSVLEAGFSLASGYLYGGVAALAPVTSVSSFFLRTGLNFALNEAVLQGSSLITTGNFVGFNSWDEVGMHMLMLGSAGLSSGASWLSGYTKHVGELNKLVVSGYAMAEGPGAKIINSTLLTTMFGGSTKILTNAIAGGRTFLLIGMLTDPLFTGKEGNPTWESTFGHYKTGLIYGGIFGMAEAIPAFSKIGAQSALAQGIKWGIVGGATNVTRGAIDSVLFTKTPYTWSQAGIDFGVGFIEGGLSGFGATKAFPKAFLTKGIARLGLNIALTSLVSVSGGLISSAITGNSYSWKQLGVDTGIGVLAGLTATALPKYVSWVSKLGNAKFFVEHPKLLPLTKFGLNLGASQSATFLAYMGTGAVFELKNNGVSGIDMGKVGAEAANYWKIWAPWANPAEDSWANTIKFDIFGEKDVKLKYLTIGAGLSSLLFLSVVSSSAFATAKINSLEDLPKLIKDNYQEKIASKTLGEKVKAIAISSGKMFLFGMGLDSIGRTYNEAHKYSKITNEAEDALMGAIFNNWGVGGWTQVYKDENGNLNRKFNWDGILNDQNGNPIKNENGDFQRTGLLSGIENSAISGVIFGPLFYFSMPLFEVLAPNLPFGIGKTVQSIQSFNFGITAGKTANMTLSTLRADRVKLALSTVAKFGLVTIVGGVIDEGISEPIAGAIMYAGLMPLVGGKISGAQLNFFTSMLAEGVSPSPFETIDIGLPAESSLLQSIIHSNGENVISIITHLENNPQLLSREAIIADLMSNNTFTFNKDKEVVGSFVDVALSVKQRQESAKATGEKWDVEAKQLGMGVLLLNLAEKQLTSQSSSAILRSVVGANFAAGKTTMALMIQDVLTSKYGDKKILFVTTQNPGEIRKNAAFKMRGDNEVNVIGENAEGKVTADVKAGQINITSIAGFEALKEEKKLSDVFVIGDEPQAGMAAPARVHGIMEIVWKNLTPEEQIKFSAYKNIHETIFTLAKDQAELAKQASVENGYWRQIIKHQLNPNGVFSRDRFEFEQATETKLITAFENRDKKELTPAETEFLKGFGDDKKGDLYRDHETLYREAKQKYAQSLLRDNAAQLKEYFNGAAYGLVTGEEGMEFYGIKKDADGKMIQYFTRNTENGNALDRTIFSDGEVDGERLNARAVMVSVKHNASPEVWLNSLMSKAENSVSYSDALGASKGYILLTASPDGFKPTFDAIGARLYKLDRDPTSLILSQMQVDVNSSPRADAMANEAIARISDSEGKRVVVLTGNDPESLKLSTIMVEIQQGVRAELGELTLNKENITQAWEKFKKGKNGAGKIKEWGKLGYSIDKVEGVFSHLQQEEGSFSKDLSAAKIMFVDEGGEGAFTLNDIGNYITAMQKGEGISESDKLLVFVRGLYDASNVGKKVEGAVTNLEGLMIVSNVALTTDIVQAGGRFSIKGVSKELEARRIAGELKESISLDDPRITNAEVAEIVKQQGESKRQAALRVNNRLLLEANAENVVRIAGTNSVADRLETARILGEFEEKMDWVIKPVVNSPEEAENMALVNPVVNSLDEVSRSTLNQDEDLAYDNDKDNPALTPEGKKFVTVVNEVNSFSDDKLKQIASLAEQVVAAKNKLTGRLEEIAANKDMPVQEQEQGRSRLAFDIIYNLKTSGIPIDDSLLKTLLEVANLNSGINHIGDIKITLQDLVSGVVIKEQFPRDWDNVSSALVENGWATKISDEMIRLTIDPKKVRKPILEQFISRGIDPAKAFPVLQQSIKQAVTLTPIIDASSRVAEAKQALEKARKDFAKVSKKQIIFTKSDEIKVTSVAVEKAALAIAELMMDEAWRDLAIAIASPTVSPVAILLKKAEKADAKVYKQLKAMYGPLVDSLQACKSALTIPSKIVNFRFRSAFNQLYKSLFSTPVSLFNKSSDPYSLTIPFELGLETPGSIEEFNRLMLLNESKKKTIQAVAKEAFINDIKNQAGQFFTEDEVKTENIDTISKAWAVLRMINQLQFLSEPDSNKDEAQLKKARQSIVDYLNGQINPEEEAADQVKEEQPVDVKAQNVQQQPAGTVKITTEGPKEELLADDKLEAEAQTPARQAVIDAVKSVKSNESGKASIGMVFAMAATGIAAISLPIIHGIGGVNGLIVTAAAISGVGAVGVWLIKKFRHNRSTNATQEASDKQPSKAVPPVQQQNNTISTSIGVGSVVAGSLVDVEYQNPGNTSGRSLGPNIFGRINSVFGRVASGLAPPIALAKTFFSKVYGLLNTRSNVGALVAGELKSDEAKKDEVAGARSLPSRNGEEGQDVEGASSNRSKTSIGDVRVNDSRVIPDNSISSKIVRLISRITGSIGASVKEAGKIAVKVLEVLGSRIKAFVAGSKAAAAQNRAAVVNNGIVGEAVDVVKDAETQDSIRAYGIRSWINNVFKKIVVIPTVHKDGRPVDLVIPALNKYKGNDKTVVGSLLMFIFNGLSHDAEGNMSKLGVISRRIFSGNPEKGSVVKSEEEDALPKASVEIGVSNVVEDFRKLTRSISDVVTRLRGNQPVMPDPDDVALLSAISAKKEALIDAARTKAEIDGVEFDAAVNYYAQAKEYICDHDKAKKLAYKIVWGYLSNNNIDVRDTLLANDKNLYYSLIDIAKTINLMSIQELENLANNPESNTLSRIAQTLYARETNAKAGEAIGVSEKAIGVSEKAIGVSEKAIGVSSGYCR